jgi:hypothetical protein
MSLRLLNSIDVSDGSVVRRIALYEGDLTDIPAEHRVDILIVSAFPNDYRPTQTSLIGGLQRSGLSVAQLLLDFATHYRPCRRDEYRKDCML